MKNITVKRLIALNLAIIMLFSMLPANVFAGISGLPSTPLPPGWDGTIIVETTGYYTFRAEHLLHPHLRFFHVFTWENDDTYILTPVRVLHRWNSTYFVYFLHAGVYGVVWEDMTGISTPTDLRMHTYVGAVYSVNISAYSPTISDWDKSWPGNPTSSSTSSLSNNVARPGDIVTLTTTVGNYFTFSHWESMTDGVHINNPNWQNGATFVMPLHDVYIHAVFDETNPVTSIEIIGENFALVAGETRNVIASFTPQDAAFRYAWFQSDNPGVASVWGWSFMLTDTITANSPGVAYITAISHSGRHTDTIRVTVISQEKAAAFTYQQIDATSIRITGLAGSWANVIIPDYLNGLRVREIAPRAFLGRTDIVSVVLPNGITHIGRDAFANCTNLTSINFPPNLICTGEGWGIFAGTTSLTTITVPEGITALPNGVFRDSHLETVALPSTLVSIGDNAFDSATALAGIDLPHGLVSIGDMSFRGATALVEILLPDSVETIGRDAFANSTNLTSINFPPNLICAGDGWGIFAGTANLTTITIPEGITALPNGVFRGSHLETVTLPSTLTSIGNYAFQNAAALASVYIPRSVISIAANSFDNTPELTIFTYTATFAHVFASISGIPFFLLDYHTHSFEIYEYVPATCIHPGALTMICATCGFRTMETFPPTDVHIWSVWTIELLPTFLDYGLRLRFCVGCLREETESIPPLASNYDQGLVHFTVVDAITLAPVRNARIHVTHEDGEENTFVTDAQGRLSEILPVGRYTLSVFANGFITRNLNITVRPGETTLPQIGISSRPTVEGQITTRVMTIDEIIEAGIDINAPGNHHVFEYSIEIQFEARIFPPLSFTTMFNENGEFLGIGSGGGTVGGPVGAVRGGGGGIVFTMPDNSRISVFPVSEYFFLIIYGEVRWLREMFDVELLVINHSMTDTMEDTVAELVLPQGLSLADMVNEAQSHTQHIGTVGHGESASARWFIRGDEEGDFDIFVNLTGTKMPFEEDFLHEFMAEDSIRVYAGSALHMTIEIPDATFHGDDYTVRITLENVSTRPIYSLVHAITGLVQGQVTVYSDGTVVEEILLEEGFLGYVSSDVFNPGDKLVIEVTTTILFVSRMIEHWKNQVTGAIDDLEFLSNLLRVALSDLKATAPIAAEMARITQLNENVPTDEIYALLNLGKFVQGEAVDVVGAVFNVARAAVNALPVTFFVTDVLVSTLENSTTEIPYTIEIFPSGAMETAGVRFRQNFLSNMLNEQFGYAYKGLTLIVPSDFEKPSDFVEAVVQSIYQASGFVAQGTSSITTFTAWIEVNEPAAQGGISPASAQEHFILESSNETAVLNNGVLTFTGSGTISVTPLTFAGGTLFVQTEYGLQAFALTVVEGHDCHSDEWTLVVPPTGLHDGFEALFCDTCNEIINFRAIVSCGSHVFGNWSVGLEPSITAEGINTRNCIHCGAFDWEPIATLPYPPQIVRYLAPNGLQNASYSFQFMATGSPVPVWSHVGNLPQGLTLTPQGRLYGTPTEAGIFTFTVAANNGVNPIATQQITIEISPRPTQVQLDSTLTVTTGFARPGETVDVGIRLDRNPGFAAMMLRVELPPGVTLVRYDVTDSALLTGLTMPRIGGMEVPPDTQTNISGTFFVGWTRTADFTAETGLLTLRLAVPYGTNPGYFPINVTFANAIGEEPPTNASGDPVSIQIRDGGGIVVRTTFMRGDVNGDTRITSADGTALARYFADHVVSIDSEAARAISGGTTVRPLDLLMLRGWLVGDGSPND